MNSNVAMVSCASSRQRGVGWDGKSVGMLCMRNRKARPWAQRRPQSQTTLPRTETHTPIIIGKKSPETYLLAKRAKDYESHSIDWCDHFRNEENAIESIAYGRHLFWHLLVPFSIVSPRFCFLGHCLHGNGIREPILNFQSRLDANSKILALIITSSSPLMKDLPKTGSAREDLPTGV
jgi:hypothetical protein